MINQAIRATLYTYISSVEEDLRGIIAEDIYDNFEDLSFLSPVRLNELKAEGVLLDDKSDLIYNLDFSEPFEIIVANTDLVDSRVGKLVKTYIQKLPSFTKLRNQVVHTRPINTLLVDFFLEFVQSAIKINDPFFSSLKKSYK